MQEMRVCLRNIESVHEDQLKEEWFYLPIDLDSMKERLGVNDEKEYMVVDYDLPFAIDEYVQVEELNRLYHLAEELEGTPFEKDCKLIQQEYFESFEEMVENIDEIKYYPNCKNMTDIARYLTEETSEFSEIPDHLKTYLNYEAMGRDLEISRDFLVGNHGIYEYCK